MAIFASLTPLELMVCGFLRVSAIKQDIPGTGKWLLHVSLMELEWQWPFHGQSYRRVFTKCSNLPFILQQEAEEIPRSHLEPRLKFFYKIGKGSSQGFSNDSPPEKNTDHKHRLCPPWLSDTGTNLGTSKTVWQNQCPSQASSPLKPSSPSPAPPFPWRCWKNPRKKHLYFNVYGMAFCIIGIIAIAL